ncbi:NAD-dependent epimerase/dehydratase family protein [Aureimonas altamirensis]|uniref:NAD-dependent epimerase/dehydratase family protein n=1 Tax=Aureimonas altamirensis TaxID=370622 RepID=UPI003016DFCD
MRILITGCAGFIGFHLARRLLDAGHAVTGLDNLSPYYDPALKRARLAEIEGRNGFRFVDMDVENAVELVSLFEAERPEIVFHLAAQAGVRHSLSHPQAYVGANIVGTFNMLEACRAHTPAHLVLASTSSIYGASTTMPFDERVRTAEPLTIYAASKGAGELMAHSYAHLYAIPTTAVRFFTVYGPWGRPDMAYYIFARRILSGAPLEINNNGSSLRDFTYIDDLVEAMARLMDAVPGAEGRVEGDTLSAVAPYRVVNAGGGQPVGLMDFVAEIEKAAGVTAQKLYRALPAGDSDATFADTRLLRSLTGYAPQTPIADGIPKFVEWYRAQGFRYA